MTAYSHANTEKALIYHVKQISTTADYARLLYCLYGYYQPLETQFDRWLTNSIPQYNERRKSARILCDIAAIGYPAPAQLATELPDMPGAMAALGCFYVLEGSVLGGAVMKKMIHAKCPSIPGEAFSFLSGYQNNLETWSSFLVHLNNTLQSEDDLQTAIAAANDCFIHFGRWIPHCYAKSMA